MHLINVVAFQRHIRSPSMPLMINSRMGEHRLVNGRVLLLSISPFFFLEIKLESFGTRCWTWLDEVWFCSRLDWPCSKLISHEVVCEVTGIKGGGCRSVFLVIDIMAANGKGIKG